MKKNFLIMVLAASLFTSASVHAHTTDSPHEETSANATVAPQENKNTATSQPEQKKANFRPAPALKPLLLVPLAIILYLIYEKLAKRT